jgi:hypothetical protein
MRVAGLFLLMAIWWATEAIPMAVTSLLPLAILPLFGILELKDVAAPYADPVVMLLLGGFIVALAIEKWNLHRRIALNVLRVSGARVKILTAGVMLATALLSMWISNTATSLMMTPIVLSVAVAAGGGPRLAVALLLGVCYAASIGGLGTPLVGQRGQTGAITTHQRGKHARQRVHPRSDIGDREADLAHLGISGDAEGTCFSLDREVVSLVIAPRTARAVPGDVTGNQRRIPRMQGVRIDAEARRRSGSDVVHEDISAGDQGPERGQVIRVFDVEHHRLFAAVRPYEESRLPLDIAVISTGEVAFRALNLDDCRTEVCELSRREGSGDRLLE